MPDLRFDAGLLTLPNPIDADSEQPSQSRGLAPLIRRGLTSIMKRGPSHALRWGWFHLNESYYERLLGVRTSRNDAWNALAYADTGELVQYEPLPYALINTVLASITGRDVSQDVFLDYGCGMGRVVLMAARKPFKRVIGVELFDALLSVAEDNKRAAHARLQSDVTLERANAANFIVPDDVSVVHLFNPFRGSIMHETQGRIGESLLRKPRHLTVFYAHPANQVNLFENCAYLKLKERLPEGILRGMNLLVYEHRGPNT